MIQHLLQLIWNQRKQNAWLWAELLLVSVFLWFLVDYLYVMGRTYTAPLGFDIRHTYSIVISSLSERSPDYIPKEKRERPDGVHLLTALDRIRTYPGVESACLTDGGMPYYMRKASTEERMRHIIHYRQTVNNILERKRHQRYRSI